MMRAMRFALAAAAAVTVLALAACKRDDPPRAAPVDPLDEKLRHCPVTVDGARTEITDVTDGIALVVTADADAAVTEILRRAAHLVHFTSGAATGTTHGGGEGGGFMRNCPVVARDTRVTAADVPGGARLTVTPRGALTVDALRADTRRRHAALPR